MSADPFYRRALERLSRGPLCPGTDLSARVLRAHFLCLGLVKRGLASRSEGEDGSVYAITEAGLLAVEQGDLP